MRLVSLCFVVLFAGLAVARATPPDGFQTIPPDRIHYIKSPDHTVQLMGGFRWDFEVKTNNTKDFVVDFGFGKSGWVGAGPFQSFSSHTFQKPVNVVTFVIIPDGHLFFAPLTKYKVIIAGNGEADGHAYFGTYTPTEVYKCSDEYSLESPPVDKNGLYRLMSAWVGPMDGEPDQNLLLGFFESKK